MKIRLQINPLRGMAIVIMTVAMPLSFLISCNRDKNETVDVAFDPQTSYTYKSTNSYSLVSDSGITRIKIITQTYLIFGKASEPYWYFPDGVYIEQFDTLLNVEASIQADTAYYFERKQLWEAKGNVDITNFEGKRFQTEHLFWDQQNKTVYSDSLINITEGDRVTTGIGFRSNQDLSEFLIFTPGGKIPVELQQRATDNDSIPPADTPEV